WLRSRPDFFIRVEPLSEVYRAKFRDAMKGAGLFQEIDPRVWQKAWNVNSQAVGDGKHSLKYLAPYVFRVAIANSRIVDFDNDQVTFRYRKSGRNRWRTISMDAMEFIRRFLQHVLPTGLMKIRHYGFLSGSAKTPAQRIRELICVLYEIIADLVAPAATPERGRTLKCRKCGRRLRWLMFCPPTIRGG
ncbi:MAG: transposase, partial [Candidatus Eisenbacteria sp.]|nr:transposase [Candidatus Eisenbacteria bacterium]